METISTAFAAILAQIFLGFSGIDYTPSTGVMVSEYNHLATFKATAISTGNRADQIVQNTKFGGTSSSLDYEVYIDNIIPYKNTKLWFGTRFAWAPQKQAAEVTLKSPSSLRPTVKLFRYTEQPSFGVLMGYNLLNYNPKAKYFTYGISPFVGISLMQTSYAGLDDEISVDYDSVIKYIAGARIRANNNWDIILDATYFNVEMRGIEGNGQDINLEVTKYRVGFAYNFTSDLSNRRANKDISYDNIIQEIAPSIEDRKELQEKEEKLERAAEEAKAEADAKAVEQAQKKADADAKAQAEQEQPDSNRTGNSNNNQVTAPQEIPEEEDTGSTDDGGNNWAL